MPPILYHSNVLAIADQARKDHLIGMGDGTLYATGTSATPDQDNYQFAISGLSLIADLSDTNDRFNGYALYFPSTGNLYHIVDYAAGGTVTVYELPATIDIGSSEFRRLLTEPNADPAYPAHLSAAGVRATLWKQNAANVKLELEVALPNFLERGGFEEYSAGALPSAIQAAGLWYSDTSFAISSSSPILGARQVLYTKPGSGDKTLNQRLVGSLKKGRAYRVLFKARTVSGSTNAGALTIDIIRHLVGSPVDGDWETNGTFSVAALSTTATWYLSSAFVPEADVDDVRLTLTAVFANLGSATSIRLDEFYIWDEIDVEALIAFDHNLDGTNPNASDLVVYRQYCPTNRSSISTSDYSTIINAGAVSDAGPWLAEGTATPAPIYRILSVATAGLTYQIGELLLTARWAFARGFPLPVEGRQDRYEQKIQTSLAGVRQIFRFYQRRHIEAKMPAVESEDLEIWDGAYRRYHIDDRIPFGLRFDSSDRLLLVQEIGTEYAGEQAGVRPDRSVIWEEVL